MRPGRPSGEVQLLSELEARWAIGSLHCCPFPPSFVCQRRAASTLRVGRWLYRTPQALMEEDRILKLSVLCVCAHVMVFKNLLFLKQGRGRFKMQEAWGKLHRNNGTLQQAERENMNNSLLYRISHLRSALIYCGNILWATLLLPSYTVVEIDHWESAQGREVLPISSFGCTYSQGCHCTGLKF